MRSSCTNFWALTWVICEEEQINFIHKLMISAWLTSSFLCGWNSNLLGRTNSEWFCSRNLCFSALGSRASSHCLDVSMDNCWVSITQLPAVITADIASPNHCGAPRSKKSSKSERSSAKYLWSAALAALIHSRYSLRARRLFSLNSWYFDCF